MKMRQVKETLSKILATTTEWLERVDVRSDRTSTHLLEETEERETR